MFAKVSIAAALLACSAKASDIPSILTKSGPQIGMCTLPKNVHPLATDPHSKDLEMSNLTTRCLMLNVIKYRLKLTQSFL